MRLAAPIRACARQTCQDELGLPSANRRQRDARVGLTSFDFQPLGSSAFPYFPQGTGQYRHAFREGHSRFAHGPFPCELAERTQPCPQFLRRFRWWIVSSARLFPVCPVHTDSVQSSTRARQQDLDAARPASNGSIGLQPAKLWPGIARLRSNAIPTRTR